MRKMLVIVIFVMLNLVQHRMLAQTNVYHPFSTDSATWRYGIFGIPVEFGGCGDFTGFCGAYNPFYLGHDTTINNNHYKILFDTTAILGFIRQDTAQKKVYAIENNVSDTSEYIVYDGNWQVGDTIDNNYLNNREGQLVVITTIDSVLLHDNTYRKSVYTNLNPSEICWVEGIGMIKGFFKQIFTFFEGGDELLCFKNDSICELLRITQGPVNCETCGISDLVGIVENDISNAFSLYPNPATTTITVQSMVNSPWSVVNIYNAQGALVLITSNIINQTLNIENLSTGLYYMHLQSAEGVAVKKFEVIR